MTDQLERRDNGLLMTLQSFAEDSYRIAGMIACSSDLLEILATD